MSVEGALGLFGGVAVLITAVIATFTSVGILSIFTLAVAGLAVLAVTRASSSGVLSAQHINARFASGSIEFVATAAHLSASVWLAWLVYSMLTTAVFVPHTVAVALVWTQIALTALAVTLLFSPLEIPQRIGQYLVIVPAIIPVLHAAVLHAHPALSIARTGLFFACLLFVLQAMATKRAIVSTNKSGLAVARVCWLLFAPWPLLLVGIGALAIWVMLLHLYTDGDDVPYLRQMPALVAPVAMLASEESRRPRRSRDTAGSSLLRLKPAGKSYQTAVD